jgi:hypothetical protein
MTTAITPEIVGLDDQPQVFEDSPMTENEEKELVIVKTAISTAYADKLERDLAIGAGLLKIFRRKLYRGKTGGRSWSEWLKAESAELTAGRGALDESTATRLRGFYQFRVEVLQPSATWPESAPLPSTPAQVRPLLGQLDTHPDAAVEMWKAAVADAKGKVPTFDQVNRAALAYKANEANEARRLSAAQQVAQQKAVAASRAASVPPAGSSAPAPAPAPEPVRDYSPKPEPAAPTIPAWELQKDDGALDAFAESKKISQAVQEVKKSIGILRGILYSQINKHGSVYMDTLRQIDAGVYSVNDIELHVEQIKEDVDFVSNLLAVDAEEGELSRSTVESVVFPTRN